MKKFELKQKIARFKKLNRKFRKQYDPEILNELIELDKYISKNDIRWIRTYDKI